MRLVTALVVLAGCGADGNPDILWLGPSANGQSVVLTDAEPFQY